jgi:hypothetical protein
MEDHVPMIVCPLCGFEFDETRLSCQSACPIAALQGCSLLCCPNCSYQMVDERQSKLARLLRRAVLRAAEVYKQRTE